MLDKQNYEVIRKSEQNESKQRDTKNNRVSTYGTRKHGTRTRNHWN